MKLLQLSVACACLGILKDNHIHAKETASSDTDNKYTYRLIELDVDSGMDELMYPTKSFYQKNIIPRVHRQSHSSESNDHQTHPKMTKPIHNESNVRKSFFNSQNASKVRIPDNFDEEILQFQKSNRLPRRVKKKRRSQIVLKPTTTQIEKDQEENNNQEEEEEVEEKKEKVHKLTIKKKRPFMNNTTSLPQRSSNVSSYSTLLKPAPSPFYGTEIKPSVLRENITVLNTDLYNSDLSSMHKDVKTRDVNVIVRTKHSPKILIRRYKPLFGSFTGLKYLNRKRHPLRKNLGSHDKLCKKCKRKQKKNQFFHQNNRNYLPTNLLTDAKVIAHPHPHINPKMPKSFSSPCDEHTSLLPQYISSFATYPHQPVHDSQFFSSYQYPPNTDNYNHDENLITPHLPTQPIKNHFRISGENYYSPHTPTNLPLVSIGTELPYTAKSEYVSAKEELPHTYNVHEHDNTEELAANHQQETNDNLEDDEKSILHYEHSGSGSDNDADGEGETLNEDYDTEEELPELNS